MSSPRAKAAVCLVLASMACFASLASAEEVTRDSYREAVEPICRQNANANARIFRGVRKMVLRHHLQPAALRFSKAAAALERTVTQLRAVAQPPEDERQLAKWLAAVSVEAKLFEQTAAKLRAGDAKGASRMVARLSHQANVSNALVVPFEFRYCRLNPSRFT